MKNGHHSRVLGNGGRVAHRSWLIATKPALEGDLGRGIPPVAAWCHDAGQAAHLGPPSDRVGAYAKHPGDRPRRVELLRLVFAQEWQNALFEVASVAAQCLGVRELPFFCPPGDCLRVDAKHLSDFRRCEQLFVLQVLSGHGTTNLTGV